MPRTVRYHRLTPESSSLRSASCILTVKALSYSANSRPLSTRQTKLSVSYWTSTNEAAMRSFLSRRNTPICRVCWLSRKTWSKIKTCRLSNCKKSCTYLRWRRTIQMGRYACAHKRSMSSSLRLKSTQIRRHSWLRRLRRRLTSISSIKSETTKPICACKRPMPMPYLRLRLSFLLLQSASIRRTGTCLAAWMSLMRWRGARLALDRRAWACASIWRETRRAVWCSNLILVGKSLIRQLMVKLLAGSVHQQASLENWLGHYETERGCHLAS